MSTVLLTPTHLACDHGLMKFTYPSSTHVDPTYYKIYRSPNRQFYIGTVGDFHPEEVDHPETYAAVQLLIQRSMNIVKHKGVTSWKFRPEDEAKRFINVFDASGHTLLVTKTTRYILSTPDKPDGNILGDVCGEYVGLGTGGDYGMGLLRGGISLDNIWSEIHRFDPVTSLHHSCMALADLEDWDRLPQKAMQLMRRRLYDCLDLWKG